MDNYKLNSTETPEKRAQIKILVIVGFIQLILTLVTEAYANFFLLIAVMAFAYLVANTDDFFLVWDSAKGLIEKYGKNIGNSRDNYSKKYEKASKVYENEFGVSPKSFEQIKEEIHEISDNPIVTGVIEVPVKKENSNNNSVIWANNDNKSRNAGSNMQSNIQ